MDIKNILLDSGCSNIEEVRKYVTNHTANLGMKFLKIKSFGTFRSLCKELNVHSMPPRIYHEMHRHSTALQPCWTCKKCTNGNLCSWVRNNEPIPGWVAQETIIATGRNDGRTQIKSYGILSCPQYDPDDVKEFPAGFDFSAYDE